MGFRERVRRDRPDGTAVAACWYRSARVIRAWLAHGMWRLAGCTIHILVLADAPLCTPHSRGGYRLPNRILIIEVYRLLLLNKKMYSCAFVGLSRTLSGIGLLLAQIMSDLSHHPSR